MPSRSSSVTASSRKSRETQPRRRRQKSIEYKPKSRSRSRSRRLSSRSRSKKRSSTSFTSSKGSRSNRPRSSSEDSRHEGSLASVIRSRSPSSECCYNKQHWDYCSPEAMEQLRVYRGYSEDHSILSALMQPFWNGLTYCIPRWVSPNTITVTGFLIGLTGPGIVLTYLAKASGFYCGISGGKSSWNEGAPIQKGWRATIEVASQHDEMIFPSWIWLWSAVALFIYMTLDALDGKQARRLRAGSPVGELLDHGLDAASTVFVHLNLSVALGMPPWMAFLFFFEALTGLFTCIWEQFTTGRFTLGYIGAPTEGIACAIIQFILTGIYGREFWSWAPLGVVRVPLPAVVVNFFMSWFHISGNAYKGLEWNTMGNMVGVPVGSLCSVTFLVFTFFVVLSVTMNIYHVVLRGKNLKKAFLISVPMIMPCVCHFLLYAAYPHIHDANFPLIELTFAGVIIVSCVKMCIARLTQTYYSPFHAFYLFFVLIHIFLLALTFLFPTDSVTCWVKGLVALLILAGFIHFAYLLISFSLEVKKYFNLDLFKLSKRYCIR